MKKLRTRNHSVVLNRTRGGDTGIAIGLGIVGIVMLFPLIYTLLNAGGVLLLPSDHLPPQPDN